jgi:hypothetical protein
MRWGRDKSGAPRLYYNNPGELDEECQNLVELTFFRKRGKVFVPPLDDDTLQVLVEDDADLDPFCELDPDVEAYTEFRPAEKPIIRVSNRVSDAPNRRLRFRTTLAHEWFHARYHGIAWEKIWAEKRIHGEHVNELRGKCLQNEIIGALDSNWPEFQAGFASCAILMPRTWVLKDLAELSELGVTSFDSILLEIAKRYDVSHKAAQWRLQQLGVQRQLRLW